MRRRSLSTGLKTMDLSPAEGKAAIGNAEERIAEIGKLMFDYYTRALRN